MSEKKEARIFLIIFDNQQDADAWKDAEVKFRPEHTGEMYAYALNTSNPEVGASLVSAGINRCLKYFFKDSPPTSPIAPNQEPV